jgi:glycosyltransferase involved in cell wall biosynthesis
VPPRPGEYLLYLGRRDPHKNLDRLLGAYARLGREAPELWLAGPADPAATAPLRARAETLGIAERVRFLDGVPYAELPALLSGALALAFPSLCEGFGLPVLEAMACGAPVVTSKGSSLEEVAGDAALLVDPSSEGELAEALRSVVRDAGLRARLRERGLERAKAFRWERTGAETAAVLRRWL